MVRARNSADIWLILAAGSFEQKAGMTMKFSEEISDVNVRIEKVKEKLKPLLEEKKRIMLQHAKDIGCTCGVIIMDYDAHRLVNGFCKIEHNPPDPLLTDGAG